MRKIIPLFLAFSLVFSSMAYAAPAVDATGAATLKKLIDDELQWRADMAKIFGQGLVTDGQTTVTPKGAFYEVSLPRLSLLGDKRSRLDLGHITLNMAPAEADAWLIQQIALPSAATLYDAKNIAQATISVGKQHVTATWHPDRSLYSKADALLENIAISGTGKDAPTVKVGALKALVNLKDNGNSTWSGPVDFGVSGIAINIPGQNPVSVTLDKIDSHNVYDRLDITQAVKIKQAAKEAIKKGLPKTDQEKKAFVASLMSPNPVDMEGLSSTLEASKFFMHDAGTAEQPRREISLNHFILSALSPNMRQEKNKIMLKTSFDGLHISFVAVPMSSLIPQTLNMQITIENLPLTKITDQFFNVAKKQATSTIAPNTVKAQEQAKGEIANAFAQLPRLLEEAGGAISIYNTNMKSDSLVASLQSRFEASVDAAMGVSGKTIVVVKGLDELVQKIQDSALKPGSDPNLLGYLMGFMTVQTKGKPGKAADGASIRNYVVELKKNGDFLLNGAGANIKAATSPAAKKP